MNCDFDCEDEIQGVTANTYILVWSSCTAVASACRYVFYIPTLFRLGQLKDQLVRLVCCPACLTSLRLEDTFSALNKLVFFSSV